MQSAVCVCNTEKAHPGLSQRQAQLRDAGMIVLEWARHPDVIAYLEGRGPWPTVCFEPAQPAPTAVAKRAGPAAAPVECELSSGDEVASVRSGAKVSTADAMSLLSIDHDGLDSKAKEVLRQIPAD